MIIHFGVQVIDKKYGLNLCREKYAIINNRRSLPKFNINIYEKDNDKYYTDEWCKKQLEDSIKNYDFNMQYFSLLDRDMFNIEIKRFQKKNKGFQDVTDLNQYKEKRGYYMMVLDDYCQLYVGTTNNIRERIRHHWRRQIDFDRLLFPMGAVDTSMLSIDSFRALDTTRIYAFHTYKTYDMEDRFINQFSPPFVCNRMAGGKVDGGLAQAIIMMKHRVFTVSHKCVQSEQ